MRAPRVRPTSMDDRRYDRASWFVLIGFLVVAATTWRDYGVTWDEYNSLQDGAAVWNWYVTGFTDRTAVAFHDFYFYGGLVNVLSLLAARSLPFATFESTHLVVVGFGALGLAIAWRFGRWMDGGLAGWLSCLFLVCTPTYYGHSFMNPKDLPVAVLFLLAVFQLARACNEALERPDGRPTWSRMAWFGVAVGVTNAVRITGFLVLACAGVVLPLIALRRGLRAVAWSLLQYLLAVAVVWVLMVASWPYAQLDPLVHPLQVMLEATRFHTVIPTYFEGTWYSADDLPHRYEWVWLLNSLPEFYLVAAALVVLTWSRVRRSRRTIVGTCLAGGLAFGPLAQCSIQRVVNFDALRHQLFVYPLLAVVAGTAAAGSLRALAQPALRYAGAAVIAVALLVTARDMIAIHPYQYAYFNRAFAGGQAEGMRRFDNDYWGLSLRPATRWWVEKRLPGRDATRGTATVWGSDFLSSTLHFYPVRYYLETWGADPSRWVYTTDAQQATTRILLARFVRDHPPLDAAQTITLAGVPLAYVTDAEPVASGASPGSVGQR